MLVKVKQNHWLPSFLKVTAITLYPRIYLACSYEDAIANHILNHEFIHVAQIRQTGVVKFYIIYLWNYAKNMIKYRNQDTAYRNIPVEADAYLRQEETPVPSNVQMVNGILQEV